MHTDEFRFLADDAARVHRLAPLPTMRRTVKHAPSGRSISALVTRDLLARRDEPVVFLHGAGLNAHTFDPAILSLGEDAISVDLPGHGHSEWRDDAKYLPDLMAEDVAHTIASLTEGNYHLVGHSLGGLTALAMLHEVGSRAMTVTLIDVTPGLSPESDAESVTTFMTGQRTFTSVDEMVDRAVEFGIGTDRTALRRGVELNARERQDGLLEWRHHFAHLDLLGAASLNASAASSPFAHLWEALDPLGDRAALIRGSHGFVTDRHQSEWRNRLTRSEIFTLEGGHNLHEHAPRELADVIAHIHAQHHH